MPRYRITTLIDITRTQAAKSDPDVIKIRQQANFNSLLQALSLRANIEWMSDPKKHTGSLPRDIGGKAVHWIWDFEVERDEVFLKDNDPVGLLKEDLDGVPVLVNLENSADIDPAAFQTRNGNQNTWITII